MAHIRKRKLADGSVAFKVEWIDPAGEPRSKQFSRHTGPRPGEAAKAFLTRIELELRQGTYVDPRAGDATFREVAEQWLAATPHGLLSQDSVRSVLDVHLLPALGRMRMGAVRPHDVQAFVNALRATPNRRSSGALLAPTTVVKVIKVLRAVCAFAVRVEIVRRSPCVGVDLPPAERNPIVIPTAEQLDIVLNRLPARYRGPVEFTMGTGLRSGEIRGLDLGRVPLLERRVTVDRQLLDVRAGVPLWGPPKTRAGYREIPLAPSYADGLSAYLAEFPPGPDGLLFTNSSSRPLTRRALQEAIKPSLNAAGIPSPSGLHVFRHYFAAGLIAAGLDIRTVMTLLGHSHISETLQTYGHLWEGHQDRVREAVEMAFPARPAGRSQGGDRAARRSQGGAAESATRHKKAGHVVSLRPTSSG